MKSQRFIKALTILCLCVLLEQACISASRPDREFMSWTPATKWEEALLAGNGVMGALVFGRPHDETIILSHAKLYLPASDRVRPIDQSGHLDEIRRFMLDGRYAEAAQIPVDLGMEEGYGGQRWSDPFMPAFDIRLFMRPSNIESYKRSVDYETGEASVYWKDSRGQTVTLSFPGLISSFKIKNSNGANRAEFHDQQVILNCPREEIVCMEIVLSL